MGIDSSIAGERASIEEAGFEELLERAANGEFASGREIDKSRLEPTLDDRFADRLAGIADAAEAAGFAQVLVIAGDRPLLLAVSDRRIERELGAEAESEGVLLPVDAAVRLGSEVTVTPPSKGILSFPCNITREYSHSLLILQGARGCCQGPGHAPSR